MTKKETKRPSHRIYAVVEGGEKGNFWREIGAAWSHGDGDGFMLSLDYLPLNGADIVLRKPRTEEAAPAPAKD